MKLSSSIKTLVLASTLLTASAFAQDQAAAAPATETPASDAAPAAEAVAPAPEAAAPAAEAVAPAAAVDADPAAQVAPAASSLSPAVIAAVGTPSAGKALVVFYRESKFVGGAVGIKVTENDEELVKLYSGQYFVLETEPGAHAYASKKDITNIETEAGETYFLAGTISMGMMSGKTNLAPSDAAGFEAVLSKLTKAAPKK